MAERSASGTLYIVATPIGNLEDITLRALRVLKEADLILAEDTRRTAILLRHFDIRKPLESYHIFNERSRTPVLIRRIQDGLTAALVSDAGTPCIADPGFMLIRAAVEAGVEPVVIPGVSALTFSISASALPSDHFNFHGFLPVKSGRRRAELERIAADKRTAVVFESPFRIAKLLAEVSEVVGPDTPLALVREATKIHEQILRGPAARLAEHAKKVNWKGECVLVIDARDALDRADDGACEASPDDDGAED
jgi:16S rRNA (cytidine1402-2'-O)-methyltransferase